MDAFIDQLAQKYTAQEIIKGNCAADALQLEQVRDQARQYEMYLDELKDIAPTTQEAVNQIQLVRESTSETFHQLRQVQDNTTETFTQLRQVQDDTNATFNQLKQVQDDTSATFSQLKQVQDDTNDTLGKLFEANRSAEEMMRRLEMMTEYSKTNVQKMEQTIEAGLHKIQSAQINTDGIDELVATGIEKLNAMQQENGDIESALKDNTKAQSEALSDFFHKESVKVYRNVQAVVLEEMAKQTDLLEKNLQKIHNKVTFAAIVAGMAFVFTLASLILNVFR